MKRQRENSSPEKEENDSSFSESQEPPSKKHKCFVRRLHINTYVKSSNETNDSNSNESIDVKKVNKSEQHPSTNKFISRIFDFPQFLIERQDYTVAKIWIATDSPNTNEKNNSNSNSNSNHNPINNNRNNTSDNVDTNSQKKNENDNLKEKQNEKSENKSNTIHFTQDSSDHDDNKNNKDSKQATLEAAVPSRIGMLFIKRAPITSSSLDSFKIGVFCAKPDKSNNENSNFNTQDNDKNTNKTKDKDKEKDKTDTDIGIDNDNEKIPVFATSWKWILQQIGRVHPKRVDFDSCISKFAIQETNSDARMNLVDIDKYLDGIHLKIKSETQRNLTKTKSKIQTNTSATALTTTTSDASTHLTNFNKNNDTHGNKNTEKNKNVNITENLRSLVSNISKNTNSNTVIKIISKSIKKIQEKQVYGSSLQRNPTVLVSVRNDNAFRFGHNGEIDFICINGEYNGSYIPPNLDIHAVSLLKYSNRQDEFTMLGREAEYTRHNSIPYQNQFWTSKMRGTDLVLTPSSEAPPPPKESKCNELLRVHHWNKGHGMKVTSRRDICEDENNADFEFSLKSTRFDVFKSAKYTYKLIDRDVNTMNNNDINNIEMNVNIGIDSDDSNNDTENNNNKSINSKSGDSDSDSEDEDDDSDDSSASCISSTLSDNGFGFDEFFCAVDIKSDDYNENTNGNGTQDLMKHKLFVWHNINNNIRKSDDILLFSSSFENMNMGKIDYSCFTNTLTWLYIDKQKSYFESRRCLLVQLNKTSIALFVFNPPKIGYKLLEMYVYLIHLLDSFLVHHHV